MPKKKRKRVVTWHPITTVPVSERPTQRSYTHTCVLDGVRLFKNKTRVHHIRTGYEVACWPRKGQSLNDVARAMAREYRPRWGVVFDKESVLTGPSGKSPGWYYDRRRAEEWAKTVKDGRVVDFNDPHAVEAARR